MLDLPPNTFKVSEDNKCDVCRKSKASYYNTTWYIHFCGVNCFNAFLKGYYREIDDIAIEMKNANDLFKEESEDEDEVQRRVTNSPSGSIA